ncbi:MULTISPECIES: capsule assembly Wzi family protein [unclassified Shewanella]|uniref:capsule assembly Wzi family protein n=1 Tax=unclassified Shewanella TaxID=196818 RepID=UPI001BC8030A|nr:MULTISPECIES: capsule assembly Wzi family protein [unclassified Shewanella]GIU18183.1 outer membrane protein in capsule/EPS biosynthesis locus [Shewanella sp. MBTL60-112-B1]GIU38987.1 outer membrane protein in capsule/EPS biosynthesis locus [Shewanella sp. MBTL60-112-B2]
MKLKLLSGLLLLSCSSVQAAWWVEPTDLPLRADIQLLSDTGVIVQPITTYPLMWDGIKQDMDKADQNTLSNLQRDAFDRIISAYEHDHRGMSSKIELAGGSDTTRFIGFGQDYRDKAEAAVSAEVTKDWFSGRLAASYHYDPIDGNSTRLDNSFAAVMLGNWIVSAGAQQKYWGPGWDSGLIQTTNARPMPGMTLSRNNSQAFETPWLNWIGPWTFTTSFSQMESDRYVPEAKHWGARGTLRPISKLEVGFSWTMQWGGEGYGNSLGDWWDGLFNGGMSEGEIKNGQENMLAGYDFRWSDTAFGIPYGIYYERIHEDYHNGKNKLINSANMGGVDFLLSDLNTRVFIEYSDTQVACGVDSNAYNCLYEHGFYQDGYRYYGKSLGSTYDNDATTLVIGGITQLGGGQNISNKFRWLRLNTDGTDTGNPSGGNPVSPGEYERVYQFDTSYHRPFYQGTLKVGGTVGYSKYMTSGGDDWDTTIYAGWERSF